MASCGKGEERWYTGRCNSRQVRKGKKKTSEILTHLARTIGMKKNEGVNENFYAQIKKSSLE